MQLAQDAEPRVVCDIIRSFSSPGELGEYQIIETLVTYYQMVGVRQQSCCIASPSLIQP